MIVLAVISSGHADAADWLLLLAVILFAVALVLSLATTVARPAWLNAATMQIAGLLALALALFVT